jgi:hypothetical protein
MSRGYGWPAPVNTHAIMNTSMNPVNTAGTYDDTSIDPVNISFTNDDTGIDPVNIIDTQDECPLCLEALGFAICITECRHAFHSKCIFKALKRKDTCPLCRSPLIETQNEVADVNFGDLFGVMVYASGSRLNIPRSDIQRVMDIDTADTATQHATRHIRRQTLVQLGPSPLTLFSARRHNHRQQRRDTSPTVARRSSWFPWRTWQSNAITYREE